MGIREKFGMESAKGAEVMVEEKFPIVRELDLSAPEIKWLNGVLTYCKKCDDEEEEREVQRYEGQSIGEIIKEKEASPVLNARIDIRELIFAYLMMLRDHERSGPRFISPETEEKIESIIVGAWERINEFYNEKYRPGKNEETYGLRLKSWRDRVMGLSERSATEKAALLTELLTILHSGGTNMGLRNFTPSMSSLYGKYSTAGSDHNFLVGLNNLGNPSFWEQNPGVVSAIGKQ